MTLFWTCLKKAQLPSPTLLPRQRAVPYLAFFLSMFGLFVWALQAIYVFWMFKRDKEEKLKTFLFYFFPSIFFDLGGELWRGGIGKPD